VTIGREMTRSRNAPARLFASPNCRGRHVEREPKLRYPYSRQSVYYVRQPSFEQIDIIRDMLAQNASPTIIAEAAGVSRQVVYDRHRWGSRRIWRGRGLAK
jgi:DNA invertase Pin-like site-specific DNA recombinase